MTSYRYLSLVGITGLGILAACAGALRADVASPGESCTEAWSARIQPIANNYCVVCHQTASRGAGLSLQRGDAPGTLLGVPSTETKLVLVEPGDPSKSYLFHKISGTHTEVGGTGERMPIGGSLTEDEISQIQTWIKGCSRPGS